MLLKLIISLLLLSGTAYAQVVDLKGDSLPFLNDQLRDVATRIDTLENVTELVLGDGTATTACSVTFNYSDGTDASLVFDGSDLTLTTPSSKTLVLTPPVYDDLRVTPAGFDRVGIADPALVSYTPTGSSIATYLYEWQVNDIAYFTVQLPHSYKTGSDLSVHVHWTPGLRGNEESGKYVGWKVDYTWADINGSFGAMTTANLSDACDGTDDKHQMTPEVNIEGDGKGISSMLICNIKRTDGGAEDDWGGTASGQLPLILEIDFHYPIDTLGSREASSK